MKWRSSEEVEAAADLRPLRDQLADRQALIEKYVPAATLEVHNRVIRHLLQTGAADHVPGAGSPAPGRELGFELGFEHKDQNGNPVSLFKLLESGPLIVCFIRGRWCPFCVTQMEAMNRIAPALRQAGAALVAVSPQNPHQTSLMADQHKFQFPLLSDAGNRMARAFGLTYRVPEEQQALYRRTFVNLPFVNGDDSWELPIPATFIIGSDGVLRFASANPDYRQRPEPAAILHQLQDKS